MNLNIQRETLLKPLNAVIGVVERKQTLPILSNIHFVINEHELQLTATDLEVELQARVELDNPIAQATELTVPGKKFADICRSLPEQAEIELIQDQDKLILRSGRSRFTLATLPAADFPLQRETQEGVSFSVGQKDLRYLLQRTHFAMAQQDVRYYLNGMLLEINKENIKAVATDGHRLSFNVIPAAVANDAITQVILPRKAVIELLRLLENDEEQVVVQISNHCLRVKAEDFTFTAKLIDGRFPDYEKVLPRGGNKSVILDREILKQALIRTSILSNEKFRGIRIHLTSGLLKISANNPHHEEAEEEINLEYDQDELETGFNVTYLLDVLNTIDQPQIKITFSDGKNSILIEEANNFGNSLFVVMPMML